MGGGELARYDYTYNSQHQIATWRQAQPGMTAKEWAIAYDARQQVSAITEAPVGTPPVNPQQVWRYQYDKSGNRTAAQEGSQTRTASYNELNQMTGQSNGGTTWFRGHVNEPANVVIAGQNARVYADGTFEALTNVGPGVQDVSMQATDQAGNTTTQTWQVDNGPDGTVTPMYDTEGNLLTDGTYTFTWDAKNRMTSVTKGSDTWSFAYDGKDRRISESKNGTPVREWVWSGTRIMEERLTGAGKHRFWNGGIEVLDASGQPVGKRLLVSDHLGSPRTALDGTSGIVMASYAFSPWGKRTRISGTEDWGTGYTGHWWHESKLSLAVYRGYDPEKGRWLSRDPWLEKGGFNLYTVSANNAINGTDRIGLQVRFGGLGLAEEFYMKAKAYASKNAILGDLFTRIKTAPETITIYVGSAGTFSVNSKGEGVITWDFSSHIDISYDESLKCTKIISSARVLAHEIDHALRWLENPSVYETEIKVDNDKFGDYDSAEEKRVIEGSEQAVTGLPARSQDGKYSEGVRHNHRGAYAKDPGFP